MEPCIVGRMRLDDEVKRMERHISQRGRLFGNIFGGNELQGEKKYDKAKRKR
jgi:hypothetical protein